MKKANSAFFLALVILLSAADIKAQTPDSTHQNRRLRPLILGASAGYTLSMIGLNELWYSDFERSSFHFFNDNNEWKQLDKVGHFYAAFHISSGSYHTLRWAGVKEEKSLLYSSLTSMAILSSIEIFDGFSKAYGASYGDLLANTSGVMLFYFQKRLWKEIKIHPKFSFSPTKYPSQRPELLGSNLPEQVLKDYNGQTYWLSLDLSKLTSGGIPKWLNLAMGYGAHDMIYAKDIQNIKAGYQPRRQYYLAIDFDFNEYHSKSALMNTLLHVINMIHIPAPALEFSSGEFKFHYAY